MVSSHIAGSNIGLNFTRTIWIGNSLNHCNSLLVSWNLSRCWSLCALFLPPLRLLLKLRVLLCLFLISFSFFLWWMFSLVFSGHFFEITSTFSVSIGIVQATHMLIGSMWSAANPSVKEISVENVFPMTTAWDSIIDDQLADYAYAIVFTVWDIFPTAPLPLSITLHSLIHWRLVSAVMTNYSNRSSIICMILSCPAHASAQIKLR